MNVMDYMPPIYILSLSDAKLVGLVSGSLVPKIVEKLGAPPSPVVVADPLKQGRLKIYSASNITAVRTWRNISQREFIVPLSLRAEMSLKVKSCRPGTGMQGVLGEKYKEELFASASSNLLEKSLGAY